MKYLFSLSLSILFAFPAHAQSPSTSDLNDILPLRSCSMALSTLIEGQKVQSEFSSDDENSFYFVDCDDNYNLGQDTYVFTPSGVYYFFIKSHADYKGGWEGTQFRLTLENKTYYFKSDVTGRMGNLYDKDGKNMSNNNLDADDLTIDPSAKNVVLNYYMKVLTGNADVKSSLIAVPATGDRLAKAKACAEKDILDKGTSLTDVYKARRDYQQVAPDVLAGYQTFVTGLLQTPTCIADPSIAAAFSSDLNEIRK